jgi:hypothetical protein
MGCCATAGPLSIDPGAMGAGGLRTTETIGETVTFSRRSDAGQGTARRGAVKRRSRPDSDRMEAAGAGAVCRKGYGPA